jgi:hypothetical protein
MRKYSNSAEMTIWFSLSSWNGIVLESSSRGNDVVCTSTSHLKWFNLVLEEGNVIFVIFFYSFAVCNILRACLFLFFRHKCIAGMGHFGVDRSNASIRVVFRVQKQMQGTSNHHRIELELRAFFGDFFEYSQVWLLVFA